MNIFQLTSYFGFIYSKLFFSKFIQERFGFTTNAPSSSTVPLNIPNLCDGNGFDAVSLLRGEIFIFKDEYLWRLTDKYRIKSGYPVKFKDIFTAFPESVKHIDAVYERSHDNSIILFSGKFCD